MPSGSSVPPPPGRRQVAPGVAYVTTPESVVHFPNIAPPRELRGDTEGDVLFFPSGSASPLPWRWCLVVCLQGLARPVIPVVDRRAVFSAVHSTRPSRYQSHQTPTVLQSGLARHRLRHCKLVHCVPALLPARQPAAPIQPVPIPSRASSASMWIRACTLVSSWISSGVTTLADGR